MKKAYVYILAAIMAVSLFTGCRNSGAKVTTTPNPMPAVTTTPAHTPNPTTDLMPDENDGIVEDKKTAEDKKREKDENRVVEDEKKIEKDEKKVQDDQ